MTTLAFALAALLLYMSGLFVLSLILKNNGVADIGYGIGFMVVIGATFLQESSTDSLILLLTLLPFMWGIRLVSRIYLKNKNKPEDFRYKAWREQWGNTFVVRSFFQVYMLQGLVIFVVALPVTLALVYPAAVPNSVLVYCGLGLWLLGFFFEVLGDYQLDVFIKKPENKGKIMMSGLWKYSRHPNYFGESTLWLGLAIMSIGLSSVPLVALMSPLLIGYLLLKVSGVPLLEKRWAGNPEWEVFKKQTSVFIPLPKRTTNT